MKQPINIPVRLRNGKEAYQLVEDYTYDWKHTDRLHRIITVPRGFVCDGASVPRLVWTLSGITPDGLIRAAALVHDYIYRHKGKLPRNTYGVLRDGVYEDISENIWTREDADKLFARIMREAGVPKIKRRAAYLGVRTGGWASW
jgi:hypothetical protein